ncbi:MAG: hypothetical protein OEY44_04255 [Candidatus Peregrinibacteria bacterium]|nr:hypothetical protein [Candidatus Peregrinibacteria bacterium]
MKDELHPPRLEQESAGEYRAELYVVPNWMVSQPDDVLWFNALLDKCFDRICFDLPNRSFPMALKPFEEVSSLDFTLHAKADNRLENNPNNLYDPEDPENIQRVKDLITEEFTGRLVITPGLYQFEGIVGTISRTQSYSLNFDRVSMVASERSEPESIERPLSGCISVHSYPSESTARSALNQALISGYRPRIIPLTYLDAEDDFYNEEFM